MNTSYYYCAILRDGVQIMQGVVKAPDGNQAKDEALEFAKNFVDFERFPEVRWDIVASERPFPKGLRLEQCEGREFLAVPVEMAGGILILK